jgi:hypothetical protein
VISDDLLRYLFIYFSWTILSSVYRQTTFYYGEDKYDAGHWTIYYKARYKWKNTRFWYKVCLIFVMKSFCYWNRILFMASCTWYHNMTTYATVPIITNVCKFVPRLGEVYSIQHYVINFISDFRQVGGFLWVLRFPPPIELTATI